MVGDCCVGLHQDVTRNVFKYYISFLVLVFCLWSVTCDKFGCIRSLHYMLFCRHIALILHMLMPSAENPDWRPALDKVRAQNQCTVSHSFSFYAVSALSVDSRM